MFRPTYRITPFLISCFEKISSRKVFIDQFARGSALKMTAARDSFNRSVHSSTWIEGNMLSLAQVVALSDHQEIVAQEKQKLEVKNCIKALRWILQNKTSPFNQERLLKLHGMMTKQLLSQERCGRYRDIQNYIVNAKGQTIFMPRTPAKVKPGISDLFVWLKQHHSEHPIIRSAIFHHEFVGIHPFVDGNGRVARAGSQWLLFNADYDPVWTLGLDEFFAKDRAKYYDMIQKTHEMDGDYTYWIEYVAKGLCEAIATVSQRIKEAQYKNKRTALTPKQGELLKLLKSYGTLGSAQICKEMNINRARVNQLISPMVKTGLVVRQGAARTVKYNLA